MFRRPYRSKRSPLCSVPMLSDSDKRIVVRHLAPASRFRDSAKDVILLFNSTALDITFSWLFTSTRHHFAVFKLFYSHWETHGLFWDKMLVADEMRSFTRWYEEFFNHGWMVSPPCPERDDRICNLHVLFERLMRPVRLSDLSRMEPNAGPPWVHQDPELVELLTCTAIDQVRRAVLSLRLRRMLGLRSRPSDPRHRKTPLSRPVEQFRKITVDQDMLIGNFGEPVRSRRWNDDLDWVASWAEQEEQKRASLTTKTSSTGQSPLAPLSTNRSSHGSNDPNLGTQLKCQPLSSSVVESEPMGTASKEMLRSAGASVMVSQKVVQRISEELESMSRIEKFLDESPHFVVGLLAVESQVSICLLWKLVFIQAVLYPDRIHSMKATISAIKGTYTKTVVFTHWNNSTINPVSPSSSSSPSVSSDDFSLSSDPKSDAGLDRPKSALSFKSREQWMRSTMVASTPWIRHKRFRKDPDSRAYSMSVGVDANISVTDLPTYSSLSRSKPDIGTNAVSVAQAPAERGELLRLRIEQLEYEFQRVRPMLIPSYVHLLDALFDFTTETELTTAS